MAVSSPAAGALDPCRPAARGWARPAQARIPAVAWTNRTRVAGPWLTKRHRRRGACVQGSAGDGVDLRNRGGQAAEVEWIPNRASSRGAGAARHRGIRRKPSGAPARTNPRLAEFLSFSRPPCCGRTRRAVSLTGHAQRTCPCPPASPAKPRLLRQIPTVAWTNRTNG